MEELDPIHHGTQVDEVAFWVLSNLEMDGTPTTIQAHALAYALTLICAGQPRNQRELLEGIIDGMQKTFEECLDAAQQIASARERRAGRLQ